MVTYYSSPRPLWHFLLFHMLLTTLPGGYLSEAATPTALVKSLCGYGFLGACLGLFVYFVVSVDNKY